MFILDQMEDFFLKKRFPYVFDWGCFALVEIGLWVNNCVGAWVSLCLAVGVGLNCLAVG